MFLQKEKTNEKRLLKPLNRFNHKESFKTKAIQRLCSKCEEEDEDKNIKQLNKSDSYGDLNQKKNSLNKAELLQGKAIDSKIEAIDLSSRNTLNIIQMLPCAGTTHDTSNEHLVIELDYLQNINPNAEREYELPNGSLDKYDNGTHKTGYADLVDRNAREIYDIKRSVEANPVDQLNQYLQSANQHCGGGWTLGNYYPTRRILDFSAYEANKELVVWKGGTGLISYQKRNRQQDNQFLFGTVVTVGGNYNGPAINTWMELHRNEIEYWWDHQEAPDQIAEDPFSRIVNDTTAKLRGGALDNSLLATAYGRFTALFM